MGVYRVEGRVIHGRVQGRGLSDAWACTGERAE